MKLTACIIAKNEADRIGPCLESVGFCDEIVVLDSGSTDGTQDLCRQVGAVVIETDWPGWVAQKNRAVRAASNDWILSLDADERVDAELRGAIESWRATADRAAGTGHVAYEVTRKVFYLGRWIRHGGFYPEWRVRLFDRRHASWGGMDPHDRVEVEGPAGRIGTGNLEHHTYRSLFDQVAQVNLFSTVAARELVARGQRGSLFSILLRPPFHVLRMYLFRLGFLDGVPGLVLAGMRGWYVFLKYAKVRGLARPDGTEAS